MNYKNPYQAYRSATHTVSKTRQVVMLYEGVLRNLKQAREAIVEKRIEDRYNKLMRASEILLGLQMSLDFSQGEEAAQALYDFYASLDSRIMQLHRSQDLDACDRIIEDVRIMHDVWKRIDQGEVDSPTHATAEVTAGENPAATSAPMANTSSQHLSNGAESAAYPDAKPDSDNKPYTFSA